jgi:hypothetical protein
MENRYLALIIIGLLVIIIGVTSANLKVTKSIENGVIPKKSNFASAWAIARSDSKSIGTGIGTDIGQGIVEDATGISPDSQNVLIAAAKNPNQFNLNTFEAAGEQTVNTMKQVYTPVVDTVVNVADDVGDWFSSWW